MIYIALFHGSPCYCSWSPWGCLDGFKPSQKCKNGDNHPFGSFGSWNIRISSPILVPNNAWVLGKYSTQWNSETPSAPLSGFSPSLNTESRFKIWTSPLHHFPSRNMATLWALLLRPTQTSYCTRTIQPSGTGLGFALASSVPLAASIGLAEKG